MPVATACGMQPCCQATAFSCKGLRLGMVPCGEVIGTRQICTHAMAEHLLQLVRQRTHSSRIDRAPDLFQTVCQQCDPSAGASRCYTGWSQPVACMSAGRALSPDCCRCGALAAAALRRPAGPSGLPGLHGWVGPSGGTPAAGQVHAGMSVLDRYMMAHRLPVRTTTLVVMCVLCCIADDTTHIASIAMVGMAASIAVFGCMSSL
jgi:hypothetical protein